MKKRLLMLGGSRFQVPAIRCAHDRGYYVITCDYLPDNPGHRFADEYHNVSTTDMEAVLSLAERLRINGIVAYASDPAAPTAAYVAEKLGLPSNPYESVLILSRKDLFRAFLARHNFLSPRSLSFQDEEDACGVLKGFQFPVLIKPVDSSGSRGVTLLRDPSHFSTAFKNAMSFSRAKVIVVEEFVRMKGFQVAGDGFLQNGRLVFRCFANEHFGQTPDALVPIGESFPTTLSVALQEKIHLEVQRLMDLLGMQQGALNFDIRIDEHDNVVLMEIGPRNGGNLIPQVIRYATGVDMVAHTVEAALGTNHQPIEMVPAHGFLASYILHSQYDGILDSIEFSSDLEQRIVDRDVWVERGAAVKRFNGSNHTLGTLIINFDSAQQMVEEMENMERHVQVRVVNNA